MTRAGDNGGESVKRELGIARCGLAGCPCSENGKRSGCGRDGFPEDLEERIRFIRTGKADRVD